MEPFDLNLMLAALVSSPQAIGMATTAFLSWLADTPPVKWGWDALTANAKTIIAALVAFFMPAAMYALRCYGGVFVNAPQLGMCAALDFPVVFALFLGGCINLGWVRGIHKTINKNRKGRETPK